MMIRLVLLLTALLIRLSPAVAQPEPTLAPLTPENATDLDRIGTADSAWEAGQVAWSPSGRWLAVVGPNTLTLYPTADPANPLVIETRPATDPPLENIRFTLFSPDETHVAMQIDDSIRVWDTMTGDLLTTLPTASRRAMFMAGGDGLLSIGEGDNDPITRWDLTTGDPLATYATNVSRHVDVAVSPDETRIAGFGLDFVLHLWDAASADSIAQTGPLDASITDIAFSPDGATIAGADGYGVLWLFAADDLGEIATVPAGWDEPVRVDFHPTLPLIVAPTMPMGGLNLIDSGTGEIVATLPDGDPSNHVLSPDGSRLAYASDPFVADAGPRLYIASVPDGAVLVDVATDPRAVPLAFTPDNRLLLTRAIDRDTRTTLVELRDTATGARLQPFDLGFVENNPVGPVTLSPDGRAVAFTRGGLFCCGSRQGPRRVEWWGVRPTD